MIKHRRIAWPALALIALAAAGCSDKPPVSGSLEEVTLKGVVRVRGKAVDNGMISFRASNVNRPNVQLKESPIAKDGTYSVTTLVGENFVSVSAKQTMSVKNRDLMENEQMIKIDSGTTTLDIDIPPKPPGEAK